MNVLPNSLLHATPLRDADVVGPVPFRLDPIDDRLVVWKLGGTTCVERNCLCWHFFVSSDSRRRFPFGQTETPTVIFNFSSFATEALGAFAKTVTSLAASQRGPLGERGVIPHQDDYRLLVTATTLGSFGFEIEEGQGQQTSYVTEESPVEVAIGQAKGIMESLVDNEEAIADAIADTDGRALDDLRGFLTVMADGEAVCSLSFRNEVFGFRDVGQVRRGIASLGRDNLREGSAEMTGRFQGFLPQSRRAEFVVEASGEVISCRVDFGMSNAEEINEILGQRVNVVARFMQVGNSRTRYTILDFGSSLTI